MTYAQSTLPTPGTRDRGRQVLCFGPYPPWEAVQARFEDLITQGHRFDCDRDVTEQAGSPSEERCHNVATTVVDSGGLQETGGDNRMAGT